MTIKFLNKNLQFLAVWGFLLFCPAWLAAQNYTDFPVTKPRLIKLIKSKQYPLPFIIERIKKSGVDFKLTAAVEEEFLAVKTKRQIIDAIRDNFRAPSVAASVKNPTKSNKDVTGSSPKQEDTTEKYEQLYYQGLAMIDQFRAATTRQQANNIAQSMKDIGLQAIKLNPSRPDAYKVVGSALLLTGNFNEAEKYGQEAINRGGSLAFPVFHMSGTPHLEVLHIGSGYITVESDQKFFQYNSREILDLQSENNYNAPGGSVAVFSISAFKNNSSADWYFSPANTGSAGEANLIMRLIQKNSMAGR